MFGGHLGFVWAERNFYWISHTSFIQACLSYIRTSSSAPPHPSQMGESCGWVCKQKVKKSWKSKIMAKEGQKLQRNAKNANFRCRGRSVWSSTGKYWCSKTVRSFRGLAVYKWLRGLHFCFTRLIHICGRCCAYMVQVFLGQCFYICCVSVVLIFLKIFRGLCF